MAPTPVVFTFTDEEWAIAMEEGMRRQSVNEAKGLYGRNRGPQSGQQALQVHLLGAAGEMAVASYLGLRSCLYQQTEALRGSEDLPGIDVKTRSRHSYDLIVQKDDNPGKKFVLVTIEDKTALIHGWCYGKEAMKERYWADPANGRAAYFVPKDDLRPIAIKRHGPYTRVDFTGREMAVITWALQQAATDLDELLAGDQKRRAKGKAEITMLLEYLADASRLLALEGGRAD